MLVTIGLIFLDCFRFCMIYAVLDQSSYATGVPFINID